MSRFNLNSNLTDQFHRPLHDLRISVIDRCNFRCTYCMPQDEKHEFMPKAEWLRFQDLKRLSLIFLRLGVHKIRITGGEPLLRNGCLDFIRELSLHSGIQDLAMTTNGSLLQEHAHELKKAGLKRLTVSLDTLDQATARYLNGTSVSPQDILKGIFKARNAGFQDIKINTVIQKGVNETDILPLVQVFKNTGITLRFIEYMDVGKSDNWSMEKVLSSRQICDIIHQEYPLKPLSPNYPGEVATRYAFADGQGEVGFISSVSQPFCRDCSRLRLSADGKLFTCLFSSKGFSLKEYLNKKDTDIETYIKTIWRRREDKYSEERGSFRNKGKDKVDMYKVGG